MPTLPISLRCLPLGQQKEGLLSPQSPFLLGGGLKAGWVEGQQFCALNLRTERSEVP